MDPATIIQLVEGSLSLALQCGQATKTLSDIAAKYKYAKLTILSMVQGLDTIQLAWSQIGDWSQKYIPETAGDGEVLLQRLQRSLENGIIIMDALEGDLKPYQSNNLSFMQRSKAIRKRKHSPRPPRSDQPPGAGYDLLAAGYTAQVLTG
ncbi:hypothetical protein HO173_007954 [Letharia columbiana]|uniref:Uncharacterized protein n=1 Tax=Letharia columbiana TaxID=112416 RepID=A0A8H6FS72_9LECA|nr:uncharacterized protein HO173_007954 [Letharia columbiana]KAF6233742.1 hypothetical protein HO173_007954 [Letharia columbiana]